MIKKLAFIVVVGISSLSFGQDTLSIGEAITLLYPIPLDENQQEIDFNYLGGLSPELEVLESFATYTDTANLLNFKVILWSPGTYYFPEIEVYTNTDTINFKERLLTSEADTMALEVLPSKNMEANLNYFDYRMLFFNWCKRNIAWLLPVILLLPVGGVFAWKYWKKQKEEQRKTSIKDQIRINVDHLIDPAFADQDKLELAQETLSLMVLLRQKKNAFKWSSREFVNAFREEMTASELEQFEQLLKKSDAYKFQNITPEDRDLEDLMRAYYEIITKYSHEKQPTV